MARSRGWLTKPQLRASSVVLRPRCSHHRQRNIEPLWPSGRNWWHGDDGLRRPVAVRPGKQYVDWDLTDPAAKGQDEVRAIRDEIERIGELPL